tara:strand:- start:532 stop:1020 length:489 start_codon:yes stop_codon:yes gene_type:complete
MAFKLRSGSNTAFKMMGSSALKKHHTPEHKAANARMQQEKESQEKNPDSYFVSVPKKENTVKTGEKKDSLLENALEFVDPTGILSWDDAGRAWNKEDKTGWDYVDMAGVIPFVGSKASKISKILKGGFDLYKAKKAASATVGASRLLSFGDTASDINEDNIK